MSTPQLRRRTRPTSAHNIIESELIDSMEETRRRTHGKPPRSSKHESDSDDPFWTWGPAILAILPSMGFLLTGGEHVRDFLLFCLMLAFMFALIKTPWELYLSSRQRSIDLLPPIDPTDEAGSIRDLARSELRFLEISYLCLSAISPLVGGWVLRMLAKVMTGTADLGWFNTTIFIIVAGMRPWSHLINLLYDRTTHLQNVIAYPKDSSPLHLETLNKRINTLEGLLAELKQEFVDKSQASTFKAMVEETVDDVQTLLRRQERKDNLARLAQESRLAAIESRFESMEKDFIRARAKQRPPRWAMANGESTSIITSFFSAFTTPSHPPTAAPRRVSHSTGLPTVPEDEDNSEDISFADSINALGDRLHSNEKPKKERIPKSKSKLISARTKPSWSGFLRDLFFGIPLQIVRYVFGIVGRAKILVLGKPSTKKLV